MVKSQADHGKKARADLSSHIAAALRRTNRTIRTLLPQPLLAFCSGDSHSRCRLPTVRRVGGSNVVPAAIAHARPRSVRSVVATMPRLRTRGGAMLASPSIMARIRASRGT
jgi:hypothetical protein